MNEVMTSSTTAQTLPPCEPGELHRQLARFNRTRLMPRGPADDWRRALDAEHAQHLLECHFVEAERASVRDQAAHTPTDPDRFVAWFESLQEDGPGQGDRLFPWLADRAPLEAMKWYLRQEMAGEAGFDDLAALTQVGLPLGPKLEVARNYWDEMGQGRAGAMHGPMLARLSRALDIRSDAPDVWEPLALANLMLALALNRRYGYQCIGALGVIELTAPARSAHVNAGLKRLGIGGEARVYFALHATLDVRHSIAWNREVLHPLVAEDPRTATWIAEGALMRLRAGARCFERYRQQLW